MILNIERVRCPYFCKARKEKQEGEMMAAKTKKRHSYTDEKGKRWTACSECERGGNGGDKDKCSSGWRVKRFNGMGCFSGLEIGLKKELEART